MRGRSGWTPAHPSYGSHVIPRDDITGCILAGGRATRMGGLLKPLLVVDGATITEARAEFGYHVLQRRGA